MAQAPTRVSYPQRSSAMPSFWMLLACLMFAVSGAFVKLSSELGATLSQTVLMRALPSVLLIFVWASPTKRSLAPHSWSSHLGRNIAGGLAMWLSFYAMAHLPLSMAFSLNYTAPLFIAGWMVITGGVNRDPFRLIAILLGFLGVIAVLQPAVEKEQWFASLIGLAAGGCAAAAWLQLRRLGRANEPEWRTVLIFSIFICVSSLIALAVEGWQSLGTLAWLFLMGNGLLGMLGQLAMTKAYGSGSTLLAAVLHYSTIIFASLIGYAVWNDRVGSLALVGIGLIITSGGLSTWRTKKLEKSPRNLA